MAAEKVICFVYCISRERESDDATTEPSRDRNIQNMWGCGAWSFLISKTQNCHKI